MAQSAVHGLNVENLAGELAFDPQFIGKKYQEERQKRLRDDGVLQYKEATSSFEHLTYDTYVGRKLKRNPVQSDVGVVIIGGGYGGLLAAVRLVQQGVNDFCILEKGASYGGTWYWNQYPGAQCDIESYIYCPLLEDLDYIPTEKYVHGPEILKHMDMMVQRWDLQRRTYFQTEVKTLDWDEKTNRWHVATERNDVFRARFVVSAPGLFHKIKLPGVDGLDSFRGPSFHTSRWDYSITGGSGAGDMQKLKDKTVGIIGTGASSVQIIPFLARDAKKLFVFQRTPASVNFRDNHPTDRAFIDCLAPGWQRQRLENFNAVVSGVGKNDLVADGWTDLDLSFLTNAGEIDPAKVGEMMFMADAKKQERIRKRVDDVVTDPKTAQHLKAWYMSMCKRPCFHDEYLGTFNRSNVTLVDTDGRGIDKITGCGIEANGQEYPLDLIIYATGFELSTEFRRRTGMTVRGREGLELSEKWRKGISTFHGLSSHGFPNYFSLGTAQCGVGPNFLYTADQGTAHMAWIIARCVERGITTVEPSLEAEEQWVQTVMETSQPIRAYFMNCTPSYFNNEAQFNEVTDRGSPYGGGPSGWAQVLADWRSKGDMPGMMVK